MKLLRRIPSRRAELLSTLLLVLAFFGLSAFLQDQFAHEAAQLLIMIVLEIILPLGMGLMAAGLLAGDPALDILLSAYRPAWQALLERLLIILAIGVLFSTAAVVLAAHWDIPLPRQGSAQMYIWLSPMLFYMGLGSAVSLVRGKMLDGGMAALVVMGGSLMLMAQIPRLCASAEPDAPCIWWLASPMMTLANPTDIYWPLNRLFWLFLGAGLLALSLRLARREEPLLHEVSSE